MGKKQRLKIKKGVPEKKKGVLGFWDYVIFGVGGVAAVVVAVWGGYYMGKQSEEPGLTGAVKAVLIRVENLREDGNYPEAERILDLAIKKNPGVEKLHMNMAFVHLDQKEFEEAEKIVLGVIKDPDNLRTGLRELRKAYREGKRQDDAIRISKELGRLD